MGTSRGQVLYAELGMQVRVGLQEGRNLKGHQAEALPGGAGEPREGCGQDRVVGREVRGRRTAGRSGGVRLTGCRGQGARCTRSGLVRVKPLPEGQWGWGDPELSVGGLGGVLGGTPGGNCTYEPGTGGEEAQGRPVGLSVVGLGAGSPQGCSVCLSHEQQLN